MEAKRRTHILIGIITKGELMVSFAKLYINDDAIASKVIIECSEQFNKVLAKEYWGNELVLDIIAYNKQFNEKNISK